MGENEVVVNLTLAIEKAQASLKEFNGNVTSFGSMFNQISAGATSAWSVFSGTVGGQMLMDGISMATDAARKLFELFVTDGIAAAEKQEEAEHSLAVAMKETGIFTNSNFLAFQQYAKSLQETTRYSDDEIMSGAALLQSLAHLSDEGLKTATKAALDLAAGLHESLEEAFNQLGRAANGSTTALTRHIGAIQKGSDNAATFANVLAAVESHFGGTAQAAVNTYTGALDQAGNAFADVQKTTGSFIVENPVMIEAIHEVTSEFKLWRTEVLANKGQIIDFIDNGLVFFTKGIGYALISIDYLVRYLELMALNFKLGVDAATGFMNVLSRKETLAQFTQSLKDDAVAMENTFTTKGVIGKAGQDVLAFGDKLQAFANKHKTLNSQMVTDEAQTTNKMHSMWDDLMKFYSDSNGARFKDLTDTLKSISKMSADEGGVLFDIAQGAAIANATIDGIAAVQKALASAPPPFNFVLAGLVGAATAVNVAKIAATPPPKTSAFADGGIVGGNSQSGDKIPVMANTGEMILNMRQQSNLFTAIDSGSAAQNGNSVFQIGTVIGTNNFVDNYLIPEIRKAVRQRNASLT